MDKKRFAEMDILRSFAMIGVILIHISATALNNSTQGSIGQILSIFINQISRFAVPVFIFLSGLGLTLNNKLGQGFFEFLKKQTSKIILLYFIWNLIYFTAASETFNLLSFIKGLVLGNNYYHLYYIPLLLIFYLSYPFALKIGNSNWGLVIAFFITIASQIADEITGYEIFNNSRNIFNWFIYFILGIWFANNYKNKIKQLMKYKKIITLSYILAMLLSFFESYYLINKIALNRATTSMRPSIVLSSIIFIIMILSYNWDNYNLKKSALKLSGVSYGVYLSHALILTVFDKVYSVLGFNKGSIIYIVTAFSFVITLSTIITIVFNKAMLIIGDILRRRL